MAERAGCVETCEGYGVTMPCVIGPSMNKAYNAQIEADGQVFGWLGYAAKPNLDAALTSSWAWQLGCPSFFSVARGVFRRCDARRESPSRADI